VSGTGYQGAGEILVKVLPLVLMPGLRKEQAEPIWPRLLIFTMQKDIIFPSTLQKCPTLDIVWIDSNLAILQIIAITETVEIDTTELSPNFTIGPSHGMDVDISITLVHGCDKCTHR